MTSESLPLVYFGKLPARGDFIRARSHINETNDIDTWVSQALTASEYLLPKALLPKDALTEHSLETNPLKNGAIKENTALYFSHIDTTANKIVTGVLIPSHDSNQRRYPLIGFGLMYHDKPKSWMNYVPIKSLSLWDDVYDALINAKSQTDTAKVMEDLNNCSLTIDQNASTHYYNFINTTTLQDIAGLMSIDKAHLIQQIIATGLLFLPTYSKGFHGLNKSISWTLPAERAPAIYMATFWHDLIHGFYQPHQLQLNTYLYRTSAHYQLLLSFTEPDSQLLSQLLTHKNILPADWVSIGDSGWTQSYIDEDIGLTRFNKILLQDDLYLYDTRQLFKQIFLAQ